MKHSKQDAFTALLNRLYTPQDIITSKMIIPKQTDKNGEVSVYIRLRRYNALKKKDEIQRKINTDVKVKPKHWSTKRKEVLHSDYNAREKNRIINEKLAKINYYINNPTADYELAKLNKEEFLILEQVCPTERIFKTQKCLVDYIDEYYQRRKKLKHPQGTIKEFLSLKNRIKKYDDSRDQRTMMEDVNITWSDDFEQFLNQIGYKDGTIHKTYTILSTVLNYFWEVRDEKKIKMSEKFKSKKFKRGRPSKNEPNPLTNEQLNILQNHNFDKPHLNKVKKLILLQCYTGVRYGNLGDISPENIKNNILRFKPSKTERYSVIVEQPLNKYVIEILDEIGWDVNKIMLQNQPYNRSVVEVVDVLNQRYDIKFQKFTSHNFRDTFISEAVAKGVNFKSILKWVGQSSYKIMDRYIKLDDTFQKKEMDKMWK